MSVNISKTGIVSASLVSERIANPFDTNTYVEPDGSAWIRVFHHNNPAAALFNPSDPFTSQVYLDSDRWFNMALCNQLSTAWELLVKETLTAGSTELKYRWIQSVNPMTYAASASDTVYIQTASANITKILTTGYSDSGAHGGLYVLNSANSYIVDNDGNYGNWWGATGAFEHFSSGIPAYANTVTTGYYDIYLRIDNITTPNDKCSFGQNYIQCNEIVEI